MVHPFPSKRFSEDVVSWLDIETLTFINLSLAFLMPITSRLKFEILSRFLISDVGVLWNPYTSRWVSAIN